MRGVHLIDDPGGEEAPDSAPSLPVLLRYTPKTEGSYSVAGSRLPGATKEIIGASGSLLA